MIVSSQPNTHNNKGEGNLEPGDPGAAPAGGGQGNAVDGIPCQTSMPGNYHVHAYLGIYANGQPIAVPDGIGMVNPNLESPAGAPGTDGFPNQTIYADCFYFMHTHDASGMMHLEADSPTCGIAANYKPPCNMSIFTFGNLLDIWGVSISANNFGPFNGPVTIYTTPLSGISQCGSPCYTPSNTYSLYTGDPRAINLYSHTVIWILVGSGNPTGASLPNVEWYASP